MRFCRFIVTSAPVFGLLVGLAQAGQAQQVAPPRQPTANPLTPGICGEVYELSGRSVVLPTGQLVRLEDYCVTRRAIATSTTGEGEEFWQAFLKSASPEAISFAQSAGRDPVVAYGATICPTLQNGATMQDLRKMQIDGGLPASFDAAVNVAAINTYCPQYQSSIGR
jgi:hypothetical protein